MNSTPRSEHFDLLEDPFGPAADPRFLYLSPSHRLALDTCERALRNPGGIATLSGAAGTGKTLLCRHLLALYPERTILILNPLIRPRELLEIIGARCGIPTSESAGIAARMEAISMRLAEWHKEERWLTLIVDEAQDLPGDTMEQIRLLHNIECAGKKSVSVVLVGQPDLDRLLGPGSHYRIASRITARYRLQALPGKHVKPYLEHRRVIVERPNPPFSSSAIRLLYRNSKGIPSLLNALANLALQRACATAKPQVTRSDVRQAVRKISGRAPSSYPVLLSALLVAGLLVTGFTIFAGLVPWPPWGPGVDAPLEKPPVAGASDEDLAPPAQENVVQGLDALRALRLLLDLWRAPEFAPASMQEACLEAVRLGLACLQQDKADWAGITRLNRPLLLEIQSPDVTQQYLVLTAISASSASVHTGAGKLSMEAAELEEIWSGRFVLFWQIPPQYRGPFTQGDKGEPVIWLRDRLREIGYANTPQGEAAVFDAALQEVLQAFQADRGLLADGIAGPLSLIRINGDAGVPGIPKLLPIDPA